MTSLWTDPIALACGAVLLLGAFFLFWAISRLKKLSAAEALRGDDLLAGSTLSERDSLPETSERPRDMTAPEPAAGSAPMSPEVANRLEVMTQRLAEMQAALTKQQQAAAANQAGVGQGFSPETVDKLLKIIGNVLQQVDVLQKSLSASGGRPNPPAPGAPPAA